MLDPVRAKVCKNKKLLLNVELGIKMLPIILLIRLCRKIIFLIRVLYFSGQKSVKYKVTPKFTNKGTYEAYSVGPEFFAPKPDKLGPNMSNFPCKIPIFYRCQSFKVEHRG